MMSIFKKLSMRVMLVLGLALAGSSAQAQLATIDFTVFNAVNNANIAITAAVSSTTSAVAAAATSINLASQYNFQSLFQVIKGAAVEQAQATNETAKMMAQNANTIGYNLERSKLTNRYTVTNPCMVIANAVGMAAATRSVTSAGSSYGRGGSSGGSGGGVVAGQGGASSDLATAVAISKGTVSAPAPEVAAKLAASGACSAFATGARATACQNAAFSAGQSNPYANADIAAETLFDGPQSANSPKKKFTVDNTVGSNERTAQEAFIRNMGTALELRSLSPAELHSDAGRRYLAVKDSYEGRMSLATYPSRRQLGSMSPSADTTAVLQRLVASATDSAFVTNYLNTNFPAWSSKGVSSDELMNLEVERRYLNKDWMTRAAATMSPEEVAREQLMNSAFQNTLMWRMIQEERTNGLVLGALLASATRTESMPELRAMHSAATK